ncbi:unnamed protein product [Chrysoparadoxa australica]
MGEIEQCGAWVGEKIPRNSSGVGVEKEQGDGIPPKESTPQARTKHLASTVVLSRQFNSEASGNTLPVSPSCSLGDDSSDVVSPRTPLSREAGSMRLPLSPVESAPDMMSPPVTPPLAQVRSSSHSLRSPAPAAGASQAPSLQTPGQPRHDPAPAPAALLSPPSHQAPEAPYQAPRSPRRAAAIGTQALPPGWSEMLTAAGEVYYHHKLSRMTQLMRPTPADAQQADRVAAMMQRKKHTISAKFAKVIRGQPSIRAVASVLCAGCNMRVKKSVDKGYLDRFVFMTSSMTELCWCRGSQRRKESKSCKLSLVDRVEVRLPQRYHKRDGQVEGFASCTFSIVFKETGDSQSGCEAKALDVWARSSELCEAWVRAFIFVLGTVHDRQKEDGIGKRTQEKGSPLPPTDTSPKTMRRTGSVEAICSGLAKKALRRVGSLGSAELVGQSSTIKKGGSPRRERRDATTSRHEKHPSASTSRSPKSPASLSPQRLARRRSSGGISAIIAVLASDVFASGNSHGMSEDHMSDAGAQGEADTGPGEAPISKHGRGGNSKMSNSLDGLCPLVNGTEVNKELQEYILNRYNKTGSRIGHRLQRNRVVGLAVHSTSPLKQPLLASLPDAYHDTAMLCYSCMLNYQGHGSKEPGNQAEMSAILLAGESSPAMREELYCQALKQTTCCPHGMAEERGWEVLASMLAAFPPVENSLFPLIVSQLHAAMFRPEAVGGLALHAYYNLMSGDEGPHKLRTQALSKEQLDQHKKLFIPGRVFGVSLIECTRQEYYAVNMEDLIAPAPCEYGAKEVADATGQPPVPEILQLLVAALESLDASKCVGIFRLSADCRAVKLFVDRITEGDYTILHDLIETKATHDEELEQFIVDAVTVAAVLKVWLRSLSAKLITADQYQAAVNAGKNDDSEAAAKVLSSLPMINQATMVHLLAFMWRLQQARDVTRMDSRNLGLVLAPNLLENPSKDPMVLHMNTKYEAKFITLLINAAAPDAEPGADEEPK